MSERMFGQVVKEWWTFSNDDTNPNHDLNVLSTWPQYKGLVCGFVYWINDQQGWVGNVLGNYPGGMSKEREVLGCPR